MGSKRTAEVRLHPLDGFYARAGRPLPQSIPLDGAALPEPYRRLLVHEGDMTPTLERHHRSSIRLRVLDKWVEDGALARQVVLLTEGEEKAVEFGAIRIALSLFPAEARGPILACQKPLGTILGEAGLAHQSRPQRYFRLVSDDFINRALGLEESRTLYGRCNLLLDGQGRTLAEIVELLPPAD